MRLPRAFLIAFTLVTLPVAVARPQPVPPDALDRRPLPRDSVIDGIPCARSPRVPVEWHRNNGRLAGCALSGPFTVAGHAFAPGTWLDFDARGVLWGAWLSTHTVLDGQRCKGEGFKKWSTRFHPNGRLAACYLVQDTIVEGVPCMAGTFWREVRGGGRTALRFDATGRIQSCQAARDTVWRGRMVRRWEVVQFATAPTSQRTAK